MPKISAIIQARVGSTRLPGKVLKNLCGKTVLAQVVARAGLAERLDNIVVATTTEGRDDAVAAEASRLGVDCFRGSETDVLDRYYKAAMLSGADIVVRITSDCPLYDGHLLDEMLDAYDPAACDYLSNSIERTYPRGLDTEVFSFAALAKAHAEATEDYEHEHVTPYFYRHPDRFRLKNHAQPKDFSHLRWTLDTPEDWAFIAAVYDRLYSGNPDFATADILRLLEREPDLVAINAHVRQKALTA
jgi:spore coat polysaccharide biosynthesis protein SpsF